VSKHNFHPWKIRPRTLVSLQLRLIGSKMIRPHLHIFRKHISHMYYLLDLLELRRYPLVRMTTPVLDEGE
jgi:hypothetical protein